jgi:hypothetical protein
MTVTSSPTLTEAQILVRFQLAGLAPASMHDCDIDVIFKVLNAVHGKIDVEYRALPSAYYLEDTVMFPSYELCSNESELEEYQGRMVVSVAFASGRDFLPDAIAELKELCIVRFAEEAARNGVTCSYAGIEGWRNFSYSECTDIESV